jgi:hypothetical protein
MTWGSDKSRDRHQALDIAVTNAEVLDAKPDASVSPQSHCCRQTFVPPTALENRLVFYTGNRRHGRSITELKIKVFRP